jgi:hypothetical protein
MAWGVLYFTLMTVCELLIFRKSANLSGKRRAADGVQPVSP